MSNMQSLLGWSWAAILYAADLTSNFQRVGEVANNFLN